MVVKAASQRRRKGREAGEWGMQLVAVVDTNVRRECGRWCRSWP